VDRPCTGCLEQDGTGSQLHYSIATDGAARSAVYGPRLK